MGVPNLGGVVSLHAQAGAGATVTGGGFAANSTVQLVDVNNNVVATATADAAGNVTFTNVTPGNFSLVGISGTGVSVATTATVTAAAVAAGAGALGAVGGVLGTTAIAGGLAAGTLGIIVAQGGNRDICNSSNATVSIPDGDPLPAGASEGACVASS